MKKEKTRAKKQKEESMTLTGHLRELRNRLVVCVVCLVASFLIEIGRASCRERV